MSADAKRLDRDVGAAAGQALHLGDDVLLPVVQHDVGAHLAGELQARFVAVDSDDQRRAHELCADSGAQADGALCEHHHGVADANAARLGARDAGRCDVSEQDDLLVL